MSDTTVIPPEELLTEQEQDVLAGGSGVGPTTESAESTPIETMEDLGIGPRDPYPSAEGAPLSDAKSKSESKSKSPEAKKPEPPASDVFGNPTHPAPHPAPRAPLPPKR